jgi:hypothetical protein
MLPFCVTRARQTAEGESKAGNESSDVVLGLLA